MICSNEGPVQQGGTQGMPPKKTTLFMRELTFAGNVSTQSLCSDSRGPQDRNPVWTLSGTTMKAYVAMRGLAAIKDPLVTWIANLETGKRAEGKATYVPFRSVLRFASAC